ncbi:phosphatase domain-containing protein [Leptospira sp. 'Mane']|uniref:phosphatase domain-containing protein n=1 Tax=Leptospira sp. 'Mane' TaxID=3387407 RepID=UPI00398B8C2B
MSESNPSSQSPSITDIKRIAVCGGSLGRERRSFIRGQVVDIGITDLMRAEGLWDLVTGLFSGDEKRITPFLDFSLAPVRKPVLRIEVYNESGTKIFSSGKVKADEDGFFSCEIRDRLPVGKHTFHVILEGLDSFRQYSKDLAHLNSTEDSILGKTTIVGKGKLRILAEEYSGFIVTSDIDQTYLATDIHSGKGKFSTLFETPEQKRALPGMPELYRQLRRGLDNAPLAFISASPHFFRRTMLATIATHKIEIESLHLKYLEGTIKGVFDKVIDTIFNPIDFLQNGFKPAWSRTKKFLGASYQSLFDQMSYKLSILLYDRVFQPTNSKEILMGDNTESDYMIFTLYQLICLGKVEGDALEDYLYDLNFLGRDAITRDAARRIRKLGEENVRIHGRINPVTLSLINQTEKGPKHEEMIRLVKEALPAGVWEQVFGGEDAFFGTESSIGMSVILHARGHLEFTQVFPVVSEMIGKWVDGKVIDETQILGQLDKLTVPEFAEGDRKMVRDLLEKAFKG